MPYCVFPNAKKLRVQTKHHIGQTKMNACGSNFTELSTLLITTWKRLSPNARSLCQVLLDLHPALLFSSYGYYQRSHLSALVPLSVNQKRPWFRERASVKTGLEIRWKPGLDAQLPALVNHVALTVISPPKPRLALLYKDGRREFPAQKAAVQITPVPGMVRAQHI